MKKFYGLTGTRLNIAIAVIAGIDFALFGYGNSFRVLSPLHTNKLQTKVLWAVF
jgi:hypothetical protein